MSKKKSITNRIKQDIIKSIKQRHLINHRYQVNKSIVELYKSGVDIANVRTLDYCIINYGYIVEECSHCNSLLDKRDFEIIIFKGGKKLYYCIWEVSDCKNTYLSSKEIFRGIVTVVSYNKVYSKGVL